MIYLVLYEDKEGEKRLLTSGGSLFAFVSDGVDEGFLRGFGGLGAVGPAELLPVEGDGSLTLHDSHAFNEIGFSIMLSQVPVTVAVRSRGPSAREKIIKWFKERIRTH